MDKFRSRLMILVLYPDNDEHKKALEKIKQNYKLFAYILHDKDVLIDDNGVEQKKKSHYHVILKFNQARWNSAVCDELGIAYNYCKITNNLKNSLLYLIHYNNTEKTPYDLKDVHGTLYSTLEKYVNYETSTEDERIIEIMQMINSYQGYYKYSTLLTDICIHGLYADYRRGYSILKEIIIEHNAKYISVPNYDNR